MISTTICHICGKKKWKILGLISTVICLALCSILIVVLFKKYYPSIRNFTSTSTKMTSGNIEYITSTNSPYSITSTDYIPSSPQNTLSTTVTNLTEQYTYYVLSTSIQYENSSRSLDNSLYYNIPHISRSNGYVHSVNLRLFSEWKGNASLYLFIISSSTIDIKIKSRYAFIPQRNTTEWQTIQIPSYVLPIDRADALAIGMQENLNYKNEIYAVQSIPGVTGMNISEHTIIFTSEINMFIGVAFSYTVVQYV